MKRSLDHASLGIFAGVVLACAVLYPASSSPDVVQGGSGGNWISLNVVNGLVYGDIVSGPDGNMWFTEVSGGGAGIGEISMSGKSNFYPIPNFCFVTQPRGLTVGSDGALWFGNCANIARITVGGATTYYPLPTFDQAILYPQQLVADNTGKIWFVAVDLGIVGTTVVGNIDPTGALKFYPIDGTVSDNSIAVGPDGNIWVVGLHSALGANKGFVDRFTPNGDLTILDASPAGPQPNHISAAGDGYLYYGDASWHRAVIRINPNTTTMTTLTHIDDAGTNFLPIGDDSLWYVAPGPSNAHVLTRINLKNGSKTAEISSPANTRVSGLAAGPDGNIWADSYGYVDVGVRFTLLVAPTSLLLHRRSASIVVSEARYNGFFTAVSSNTRVATVSPPSGSGPFLVSPVGNGVATLTIADRRGNSVPVSVQVSK